MTSSRKLKSLQCIQRDTLTARILESTTKLQRLCRMAHNKQLKSTAATMHCTLPFCIVLCLVDLLGWLAAEEFDHELETGVGRV